MKPGRKNITINLPERLALAVMEHVDQKKEKTGFQKMKVWELLIEKILREEK